MVEPGAIDRLPEFLEDAGLADQHCFIITDSDVNRRYGRRVVQILDQANIQNSKFVMPAGEGNKTLEQVERFLEQLSENGATRSDTLIALGGGVPGDLGGFVAAIYNRGVPLVQVPTTLLAMVDSSIGGKTGVDHAGKNKAGAFYQPKLIVADPEVLETLSPRVYTEGFGEIVKYGILDAKFLPELESLAGRLRKFSPDNIEELSRVISRSVRQKIDVIVKDPLEKSVRLFLNYGHTLGHGLESAGGYTELLHGEAVTIGMTYAAELARRRGVLESDDLIVRQTALLREFGLPIAYDGAASLDAILGFMAKDKKRVASRDTRFVLPKKAGEMVMHDVENDFVRETVQEFLGRTAVIEP